jgi:hypothetical protein
VQASPCWILESHNTLVPARTLAAGEAFALWQDRVPDGDQVDARFGVNATGPVHTYVVVTDSANLSDVLGVHQTDAPGALASLQAGVYEHDTWLGEILTEVPPGPAHVGFMVNTSSASGLSQVQAFPASVHYDDSASEAAGMYGNVYDLTIRLRHADGGAPRRVRAWFASLDETALPAYWDGVALVNSVPVVLRHTPLAKKTLLVQVVLSAGEEYVLTFRAMVPGLTTLPQALYLESE